jgi:hypothetical protein
MICPFVSPYNGLKSKGFNKLCYTQYRVMEPWRCVPDGSVPERFFLDYASLGVWTMCPFDKCVPNTDRKVTPATSRNLAQPTWPHKVCSASGRPLILSRPKVSHHQGRIVRGYIGPRDTSSERCIVHRKTSGHIGRGRINNAPMMCTAMQKWQWFLKELFSLVQCTCTCMWRCVDQSIVSFCLLVRLSE